MKTCFENIDLREDIKEYRTPIDNRTWQRKQLVKRVKEIKLPYYKTNYGIRAYLRVKDMHNFKNQFYTHTN